MKRIAVVAAAISLLAGIVWAARPLAGPGDRVPPEPGAVAAAGAEPTELGELRDALARARQERQELAEEVAWLREELQRLVEVGYDEAPDDAPGAPQQARAPEPPPRGEEPYFDEDLLIARGMYPDEISDLREHFETTEMRELFLRDQAVRQGWFRSPRFKRAQRSIHVELRQEIGDETYDAMMYAAGRRNRVRVAHVLHDSPALTAGLQVGDLILSYGSERVFTPRDLLYATSASEAGRTVQVTVLRDGEERAFYLPAGPMGTRISRTRGEPIL